MARNLALDYLKTASPQSLDEPTESGETKMERLGSTDPGSLERLLDQERHEHLERKLGGLPALHREALTLRFEEEMTFEEIAEVRAVPVSTAKTRAQRALAMLRERMT